MSTQNSKAEMARREMEKFAKEFETASAKQDMTAIGAILEKLSDRVIQLTTDCDTLDGQLKEANSIIAAAGSAKGGALPPEVLKLAQAKKAAGLDWETAVECALRQVEHDKALAAGNESTADAATAAAQKAKPAPVRK